MCKKILIIDDDADILEILSYILTESGYAIQALINGEQVFETIKTFSPDLILMDVMLANMDGRVICKSIKNRPDTRSLPIILISGTHNLASSLQQEGAPNDFVAKPFDIDFLLKKVERHLTA